MFCYVQKSVSAKLKQAARHAQYFKVIQEWLILCVN